MFIEEKRERTEVHKECKLISTKDGIIILKAFDGHRLCSSFSVPSVILICFFSSTYEEIQSSIPSYR